VPGPSDAVTVSQLARAIRGALEDAFRGDVWVRGEVSNLRAYGSGHWYFTLKDRDAQLRLAMFARANRGVRFRPKDGDEVLVRGRVDLYAARGDLQLIAEEMHPLGAGRLQEEFERLKARLAAEGLFDAERKKPLPAVPRRVGIVTSEQAAALQDMLRVLALRDPTLSITLSPCRVQGQGAAESIAAALDRLNRHGEVEVILCGRGGGSIEDLWAFNEEVVARAIARSAIPVISGVGHETDVTIADFVADARALTPTAAAEMAVAVRADLEDAVADRLRRLRAAGRRDLERRRRRVAELAGRLLSPRRRLDRDAQRLDDARQRLARAALRRLHDDRLRARHARSRLLARSPAREVVRARRRAFELHDRLSRAAVADLGARRSRLVALQRALRALGPLSTLERGFAIVSRPDGAVVEDAASVAAGDAVQVRLRRGTLDCRVEASRAAPGRGGDAP
jgi:exodeoxyribonuclease VII large subunit